LLLVLFLLVALWQGAAPGMARSDEPTASTVPRTLIQDAGLLITMDPQLGDGPLRTLANADLLFAGDSIVGFQLAGTPGMQNLSSLREAAQLAHEWDVKLNVHLLKNIKQRDSEPIQSLKQSGALDLCGNLLVNHAIHLTDEEIILLAKHNVRIAHNPQCVVFPQVSRHNVPPDRFIRRGSLLS
jgi:cytosine/adenosine deaminase-related metal-dependent hydrolase